MAREGDTERKLEFVGTGREYARIRRTSERIADKRTG